MRNIIHGIEATRLLVDAQGDAHGDAQGDVQGDVQAPWPAPESYVVMWHVVTRPGTALPRLVPIRE